MAAAKLCSSRARRCSSPADRAVKYRDITRATDGNAFELQITTPGEINAFPGKTLGVLCEKGSMRITTYASHADYMQDQDAQSVVLWFKDRRRRVNYRPRRLTSRASCNRSAPGPA